MKKTCSVKSQQYDILDTFPSISDDFFLLFLETTVEILGVWCRSLLHSWRTYSCFPCSQCKNYWLWYFKGCDEHVFPIVLCREMLLEGLDSLSCYVIFLRYQLKLTWMSCSYLILSCLFCACILYIVFCVEWQCFNLAWHTPTIRYHELFTQFFPNLIKKV